MMLTKFTTTHKPHTTERKLALMKHQLSMLDSSPAVIVNRAQLAEAHREARHVSAVLHNLENLDDLGWEEMNDLCRTAYRAAQLLEAIEFSRVFERLA